MPLWGDHKMNKSTLALAASLILYAPADAALFVSGDSNILGGSVLFSTMTGNQAFIRNIAGTAVLIQNNARPALDIQADEVSAYLQGNGISSAIVDGGLELVAADFVGQSLFIGIAPDTGYTPDEILALSEFLTGGGNVLLTGENIFYQASLTTLLNETLFSLGSSMRIAENALDGGYREATILAGNAYTAGSDGFLFALAGEVTGGTALYGSTDRTPFVAFEEGLLPPPAVVPEPATWATFIIGFGAIGSALRRRKPFAA